VEENTKDLEELEKEAMEEKAEEAAEDTAEDADNSADEDDAASEYNDMANEFADLEEKLSEANDKYLRLFAEFDNYRKRTAKEKTETFQNASVQCVEKLLTVIDSFERSLEADCTDENYKNGMELIWGQLQNFLTQMNVKEVEALGAEFDPNVHNAIQQQDGTDYASNHVCAVFQKGYMLGDKLIRPAMVAVAV
jgi:molecular chaperone GrpE